MALTRPITIDGVSKRLEELKRKTVQFGLQPTTTQPDLDIDMTPKAPIPPTPSAARQALLEEKLQLEKDLADVQASKPLGHWMLAATQAKLDECNKKLSPTKQLSCDKAATSTLLELTTYIEQTKRQREAAQQQLDAEIALIEHNLQAKKDARKISMDEWDLKLQEGYDLAKKVEEELNQLRSTQQGPPQQAAPMAPATPPHPDMTASTLTKPETLAQFNQLL
eukprot:8706635-Karenia_brevis.AAC.1